jgi:ribose/xylose/arabinose/galactoside ABC-type transport system permease subunit
VTGRRIDAGLVGRLALAAAMFVVFAAIGDTYATSGNLYAIFEGVALSGIIALGVGVTMIAGELDLSVASVAAVAGIVAVKLANAGVGLVGSVAVVFAAGIVFGALQGYVIARLGVNSLVFTIGTLIAVRGLAYVVADEQTVPLDLERLGMSDSVSHRLWIFSPFSLITIGAFVLVGLVLGYHRYGREIYAIGGGRNEAVAAGISTTRPVTLAFATSAGLAALAGGLVSLKSGGAAPFALDSTLLTAVTAALVGGVSLYGGKGDALGIFIGMLTLQFLLAGLSAQGAPFYVANLATAAFLLVFLTIEYLTEDVERRRLFWRSLAVRGST